MTEGKYLIGLAGGIGSGKSTVARVLELLGIPRYDSDSEMKRLYDQDAALHDGLEKLFGAGVFAEGRLDRRALSKEVFGHPERLEALNALAHPALVRDFRCWMQAQTAPAVLFESALLFSARLDLSFDRTLAVVTPLEERVSRVCRRSGLTRREVLDRISHQLSDRETVERADQVIYNAESDAVLPQLLPLVERLNQLELS